MPVRPAPTWLPPVSPRPRPLPTEVCATSTGSLPVPRRRTDSRRSARTPHGQFRHPAALPGVPPAAPRERHGPRARGTRNPLPRYGTGFGAHRRDARCGSQGPPRPRARRPVARCRSRRSAVRFPRHVRELVRRRQRQVPFPHRESETGAPASGVPVRETRAGWPRPRRRRSRRPR